MKKVYQWLIYFIGLMILALGLIPNTKAGLVFAGEIIGIGIGTVIAVVCVGRVIAIFNYFTYDRQLALI